MLRSTSDGATKAYITRSPCAKGMTWKMCVWSVAGVPFFGFFGFFGVFFAMEASVGGLFVDVDVGNEQREFGYVGEGGDRLWRDFSHRSPELAPRVDAYLPAAREYLRDF